MIFSFLPSSDKKRVNCCCCLRRTEGITEIFFILKIISGTEEKDQRKLCTRRRERKLTYMTEYSVLSELLLSVCLWEQKERNRGEQSVDVSRLLMQSSSLFLLPFCYCPTFLKGKENSVDPTGGMNLCMKKKEISLLPLHICLLPVKSTKFTCAIIHSLLLLFLLLSLFVLLATFLHCWAFIRFSCDFISSQIQFKGREAGGGK